MHVLVLSNLSTRSISDLYSFCSPAHITSHFYVYYSGVAGASRMPLKAGSTKPVCFCCSYLEMPRMETRTLCMLGDCFLLDCIPGLIKMLSLLSSCLRASPSLQNWPPVLPLGNSSKLDGCGWCLISSFPLLSSGPA